jgi:ribonuclease D
MEGLVTACLLVLLLLLCSSLRRYRRPSLVSLINSLEGQQLKPYSRYTMIEKPKELKWLISHLRSQRVIGVDLEHSSQGYRGEICLMQVSTSQDFLIDVLALRDQMQDMKSIFESETLLKVMHGAYNDVKWLYENYGFKVRSLYDTQQAHSLSGETELGLDKLWRKHCNFTMDRSHKKTMQSSDWRARPLDAGQLNYAATDSHYLLYLQQVTWTQLNQLQRVKLLEKCQEITQSWAVTNSKAKLKKYEAGMDSATFAVLKALLDLREEVAKGRDINPRELVPTKVLAEIAQSRPTSLEGLTFPLLASHSAEVLSILTTQQKSSQARKDHLSRKELKQQRFEKFVDKYSVKKAVYENCKILAPDGELLCYSNKKNAMWYVEKALGEVVTATPLVVKLNFEPAGRGFSDIEIEQEFYLKELHNHCVVCGSEGSYLRYHVVPLLYRQYYPVVNRNSRCRDLVLLCPKCHERASASADKLVRSLSAEFNVPVVVHSALHTSKTKLELISKKAKTLSSGWNSLPSERKQRFIQEIKDFCSSEPAYHEFISSKFGEEWFDSREGVEYLGRHPQEVLGVHGDVNWKKESLNLHGQLVVEQLANCKAFSRRWRHYFVDELAPKFLSEAWLAELEVDKEAD